MHCSSELDHDHPPIIIYEAELTRQEEHLEKFFSKQIINGDLTIKLCSDAYGGYSMLQRLYPEIFTCCNCMSHCRRRFVDALNILKKTNKDISDSVEWKAVKLFEKIFAVEEELDDASAARRLEDRQEKSRPLVEELFNYLKKLDLKDPSYSETLADAVSYALNHEEELSRFLDDGHVPIDNNFCERCVKNIAISRKNSLFSTSKNGARSTVIIMSMVRTAAANDADPYFYLLYLLTKMPKKYYSGKANEDLEAMMPWSPEYRKFEEEEKQKLFSRAAPPGNERPLSPRDKKKKEKQRSNRAHCQNPFTTVFSKNRLPFTSASIGPLPMPI